LEEGNCFTSVPLDHWTGEYFNNTSLSGGAPLVRDEGAGFLNFDFGLGSPRAACGLGVDNFSARWTRRVNFTIGLYRFTVTGDDGVRLYIDGQLKIDKWFVQAPTTYTADLFLSTGPHDIRLEYFEGAGGAVAQLSWETLSGANCFTDVPFGHWKGEYYGGVNLSGNPMMIRDEGEGFLNFDFGDGSPSSTCVPNVDNFSARWSRTVNFPIGLYRFTVTGDDGVRLYIDGQLKIDKWFVQAPTTYTVDVFLNTSLHDVRLEYFEACCGAVAQLSWQALNSNCYADVPTDHWQGEYFNNTNLTGAPAMVRDDGVSFLDFDFGEGSPSAACGVGVDNFSARWMRRVNFTSGTYRFTVTGDDGVRLYVNGSLVIDKWFAQGPTTYTADVSLFTGNIPIRLEYFEGGGGAVARLSWEALPSDCFVSNILSGHWKGEYYNNTGLMGAPAMVRDDGVDFLNFDFGNGGPSAHCGLGVDNFSARWTRSVNFTFGTYRFTVTGDDGVRLYINGLLVLDKWFAQAPTTYTVDRTLGGFITIKLEYFESVGGAQARLNWTQIGP